MRTLKNSFWYLVIGVFNILLWNTLSFLWEWVDWLGWARFLFIVLAAPILYWIISALRQKLHF